MSSLRRTVVCDEGEDLINRQFVEAEWHALFALAAKPVDALDVEGRAADVERAVARLELQRRDGAARRQRIELSEVRRHRSPGAAQLARLGALDRDRAVAAAALALPPVAAVAAHEVELGRVLGGPGVGAGSGHYWALASKAAALAAAAAATAAVEWQRRRRQRRAMELASSAKKSDEV